MNKRLILLLTVVILAPAALLSQDSDFRIPTPIRARSGEPAVEFTTTSNASKVGVPFVTGYKFTVKEPVALNTLGAVLESSSMKPIFGALPASLQVSLWDESEKLLASATVSASDPLEGHFNYHAVREVVLEPGRTYTIASLVPAGSSVLSDVPGITTGSAVVYGGGLSVASKALLIPTADSMGRKTYFGASFTYLRSTPVGDPPRANPIRVSSALPKESEK
jgi:hypothetical protein